ncbi:MAG: hypothetical protein ACTH2P_10110 [Oceanisphaera sp.]
MKRLERREAAKAIKKQNLKLFYATPFCLRKARKNKDKNKKAELEIRSALALLTIKQDFVRGVPRLSLQRGVAELGCGWFTFSLALKLMAVTTRSRARTYTARSF